VRGAAAKRDEALGIATRGADSEGFEESRTESRRIAMRRQKIKMHFYS